MADHDLSIYIKVDESDARNRLKGVETDLDGVTAAAERADEAVGAYEKQVGDLVQSKQAATGEVGKFSTALKTVWTVLKNTPLSEYRKALNDVAEAAGLTAGKLGLLKSAGLVMGAAYAGWNVGRMIADFFDLDIKIGNATAKLMRWGDLTGQTSGAMDDVINKAKAAGMNFAGLTTKLEQYNAASAFNKKVAEQQTAAWKALIDTTAQWQAQLDRLKGAGQLDNLKADIKQHVLDVKELSVKYQITEHAVQLYKEQIRQADQAAAAHARTVESARRAGERAAEKARKLAEDEAKAFEKLVDKVHELEFGFNGLGTAIERVGRTNTEINFVREFTKNRDAAMKVEDSVDGIGSALERVGIKVPPIEDKMLALFRSWADINSRMRQDWANTWEAALDGTISFGDAFVDTLKQAIVDPFKRMIAQLIADWEYQLLSPMIGMFRQYTSQLYSGGGGGGMSGALLGSFAGGGGGTRIPGGEFDPNVVYGGKAGGGMSGMGTMAGYAGIGLGSWMLGNYLGGKFENKYAGAAIGAGAGAATGAAIGSVVPGIGTGIGAGVGAIAGAIAGWRAAGKMYEEVKKQQEDLIKQFGGIEGEIEAVGKAYEHAGKTGTEAQAALKAMWDARTPEEFAKAVKPVAELLDKFQKDTIATAKGVDDIVNAGRAYGRVLPPAIRSSVEELMKMKGITDEQKKSLQEMLDAGKPNYEALTQKAASFGITIDALGPKFQQVSIEARSKDLSDFLEDATLAGGDVGGMLAGLSDEISSLVNDSIKFGTAIPDNMKPYIEELARAGKLTDENGKKIEDITGIKFEATPLDQGLENLNKTIQDLINLLSGKGGVTDSINKIGQSAGDLPKNPFADWKIPESNFPDPAYGSRGGMVTNAGIQYMAAGGRVLRFPSRGRDTVPAMLTPGEQVLPVNEARAYRAGRASGGPSPAAATPATVVVVQQRDGQSVYDALTTSSVLTDDVKHNLRGAKTRLIEATTLRTARPRPV